MNVQYTVQCAICQTCASPEDDEGWGALYSCGHVFHEDCVAKALEYKKECPICRAPTKRPERDKRAEQHRIYLPLAPQSAPGLSQNPDTVATPGRLIVTRGEYSAKISEAEELRKEVKELHATIKEEARKLEAATAALQEETKKLRVMELEADELRDKAEEERLRLAEDVLVKERELKKLRDEKHTMKSQLEQQANFYKGKAVREERENKKHVKEVATLQLLLDKELGSKDLSAIAKKLGASSKDEDATLAFQNAIDLRNAEYRQLLLQKKKLDSERRDLALKVAEQKRELHQLKVELKACAQPALTPAQQQQQQRQGRPAPISYNTPEEDLIPVRLPVASNAAAFSLSTDSAAGRPGVHANRSPSCGAGAAEANDAEVVLDVGDDGGLDGAWAAEFASRARVPAGNAAGQTASAGPGRPQGAAEDSREGAGYGGDRMQLVSGAAPRVDGFLADGEVACSIQNDSPDGEDCPAWDEEEERKLLDQMEGTAVDLSVSAEDVSALLDRGCSAGHSSQATGRPDTQPASSSGPGRPASNLSRLGGASFAKASAADGAAADAAPLDASLGGGKENLRPQAQPQHALGVQLALRWQADAAVASLDEAAIRSQESSRQPPARKRLKRLYSPDSDCGKAEPLAKHAGDEASLDFLDEVVIDEVIDLDCDEGDDAARAAPDWCQDSQPLCEYEAPRLSAQAAVQPASSVQELSGGAAARSGALGSGQQHSGDSLGTSSFLSNRDSGSSRWKQSFSHASSSLGLGVGKGRGSFLHKKPPGSGGPNGQFVCRGADGKGGRTTVLKTASLLQTGMKRAAWPAASTYGSGAARSDSHMKTKSEKARTVQGTASIAQFFSKGPKS